MASRPRGGRLRRTLAAALVTASVAAPISAAAGPADVPAPPPAVRGPLPPATPGALAGRYAATRADLRAAERTAAAHGDGRRAAALHAMADPARRFLEFDGRDGGRTAEVLGDLARAERVAVFVPGAGTSVDDYQRLRDGAAALRQALGDRSAVIAWLGYRTPAGPSAAELTSGRADQAAPRLRAFVGGLAAARPTARISLVCHSYGTVVCARAASGLPLDDVVLLGSPGVGADSADRLHTRAAVWAARSTGDWIADVPHVRIPLAVTALGLGTDPVSPRFGARVFDAGSGGHGDYFRPGSVPLGNIARILQGQQPLREGGHA